MEKDWVKDYRSTLEWGWFTDVPVAHLWEYLRLRVNFTEGEWMGIKIKPGSVAISEARISAETGLSRQQVRTALKKLASTKEITKVTTKNFTIITVNKWEEYQGGRCNATSEKPIEQPSTNQEPTKKQPQYKNVRREEGKKEEYIYLGEFKNVKFTADEFSKLKEEFPTDYQDRIERVSSYCASTGKKYKNYLATIRNWARKDPKPQEEPTRRYEQPW